MGNRNVYVIFSAAETSRQDDNEPMFWSGQDGWGCLASAHKYSQREKDSIGANLPLPDGRWVCLFEVQFEWV